MSPTATTRIKETSAKKVIDSKETLELFRRYAQVRAEAKRLEELEVRLSEEIGWLMEANKIKQFKVPYGTFSMQDRPVYKYSEDVDEMNKMLLARKALERKEGIAEKTVTPTLRFQEKDPS